MPTAHRPTLDTSKQLSREARRHILRQWRQALPLATRTQLDQAICHHCEHTTLFQASTQIAFYLAQQGEVDCGALLIQANKKNKHIYLPVLHGKQLRFARYQPGDTLQANRYGILEPTHRHYLPAEQLELVLTPLVGFDQQGNRLGMGGGYYDRSFSFLQHNTAQQLNSPPLKSPRLKSPRLVGLAYTGQAVDRLAAEPWDIPLHGIVTEIGYQAFAG